MLKHLKMLQHISIIIQIIFRELVDSLLTHCGRVTQICVFTLQLCKTDDANLRF